MSRRGPGRSLAAVMGTRIRAYRDEQGWTQDRLGRAVDCDGDLPASANAANASPATR
jgi:hypothetical protein